MNVIRQENCFLLQKESHTIARCAIQPGPGGILLTALSVDPCWQRRGYGSYLLKEVLRSTGGFVRGRPACTGCMPRMPPLRFLPDSALF